ncbi:MAG: gamma-glutamyltransferase, partial [Leptolyngbya sp. SIO1D8]|nr:gamma-glutamyltransferase [Leptolyngbya sp. SIO1D8]
AAPRLSQRNGGVTLVDQGFENTDLGAALSAIGHQLSGATEIGAATGILVNSEGVLTAVAESVRRGGGSAKALN